MIVDTDILIWYARNNPRAVQWLHAQTRCAISVVTYMEVAQGVRNKRELQHFRKALAVLHIKVLQIDELISTKAMFLVEQYALSHGVQLDDALIAATAVALQLPLATGNTRHYRPLPDLELVEFRPN